MADPSKTFKQLNDESSVEKIVKKTGLSLAITFTKEDCKKFSIKYGDVIRLDLAEIIKV